MRLCILPRRAAYLYCCIERRVIEKMVIMKFSETQEHEMYTRYYIRSFYNGKAPNLLQPQVAIQDLLQSWGRIEHYGPCRKVFQKINTKPCFAEIYILKFQRVYRQSWP